MAFEVPKFKGFSNEVWEFLHTSYNKRSINRISLWERLLIEPDSNGQSELDLLEEVNTFFNSQIKYRLDRETWRLNDYWATPFEALAKGKGDCEDYAIAKYITLVKLGIPEAKLRFMYVTALDWNEPHMVLIYLRNEGLPLVLDNINPTIQSADKRTDLEPIYSFNANGFWMASQGGLGGQVAGRKGVPKWTSVLDRMPAGFNHLPE